MSTKRVKRQCTICRGSGYTHCSEDGCSVGVIHHCDGGTCRACEGKGEVVDLITTADPDKPLVDPLVFVTAYKQGYLQALKDLVDETLITEEQAEPLRQAAYDAFTSPDYLTAIKELVGSVRSK